jgi:hypothetical protein
MQTKSAAAIIFAFLLGLTGCNFGAPQLSGPSAPAVTHSEPWAYNDDPGVLIHTEHYDIYTTIADPDVRRRLADVMEGALGEYQRVAPGVPLSSQPMDCFFFRTREEWVDFTRRRTGVESYIYLQINRGGYTKNDWYAGFWLGSIAGTMSVAAHEGWHQFAYRNFKGRLPPFLEEGIATMYEDLQWEDDLPRWNLAQNHSRLISLRNAMQGNYLYPLRQLSAMHAGMVVAGAEAGTEAFYGQSWAFASFLWSGEDGKYRPALRRLLSDIADGSVYDPSGAYKDKSMPWNPAAAQPMLERYLGLSFDQIDAEYKSYIKSIAIDDYAKQWN